MVQAWEHVSADKTLVQIKVPGKQAAKSDARAEYFR